MSSKSKNFKKIAKKIIQEDLLTIFIFLLLIISIYHGTALFLGYFGSKGVGFATPSVSIANRAKYNDSDGDLLPDYIESAPRGEDVYDPDTGRFIGKGTGSDPFKIDTDGDLFTDGSEDNLGTSPTNWFSPGWFWILWLVTIVGLALQRVREPDRLKEYVEFDELQQSGGVATKESKFAHGGTSIFAQRKTSELSEEEKAQVIKGDIRFQRIMGEGPQVEKKKRKWKPKRLAIQLVISLFVVIVIIFISRQ